MSSLLVQLRRDFLIAVRGRSELANPLAFFVLVVVLFGLGVGTDPATLSAVGPGAIWVVALFANMLALEGMFRRDFDDGSLELFLIHNRPLFVGVLGKLAAQWSTTGLPLALLSPLAAVMLNVDTGGIVTIVATLLLGTPALTLIGAIGSALTVGLSKGGLLLSVIVMPLYVPVLIFGSSACYGVLAGDPITAHLLWLTAILLGTITLAPFAIAAALRISQEY